jgi:hypothetical protein
MVIAAFWFAPPALGATAPVASPDVSQIQTPSVLSPLVARKLPVFLSRCELDAEIHVLWFVVGDHMGSYVEYMADSGDILNGGDFRLTRRSVDRMDLMGGVGTQTYERRIIRGLLKSSFQLLPSSDIRTGFLERTHKKCILR